MPGPLVLVAAGGLAREVLSAVRLTDSSREVYLVDDDPDLWEATVRDAPVIGGLEAVPPDAELLVCAGSGVTRRKLVDRLALLGIGRDRYATMVHPGVVVPVGCSVGAGSILLAQVAITADVHIADHVVIMPHVTLTHDDVVADYATLAAGVSLGGGVRVGPGAYLGMHAAVRENLSVGAEATLGMGAVLLVDQPDGTTWTGVPAGPMKESL